MRVDSDELPKLLIDKDTGMTVLIIKSVGTRRLVEFHFI